jgi:uncharacterized LabA/DUF88 family protein
METIADPQSHQRVAIFVDYHNVLNALRRIGRQVDLIALREYLAEGRHLVEAFLYIATHPLPERQAADQATLQRLRQHGFLIRTRTGQFLPTGQLKCDFSTELALDVQEFVVQARPDIVVLVTGDGEFTPLAERLRSRGIRVEVASTPGSVSAALRAMANGFVDLTQLGQAVENLPIPGAEQVIPVEAVPEPQLELEPALALEAGA